MKYTKKKNRYIKAVIIIIFAVIVFNISEKRIFMNMDDEVYKKVFYNFSTFKIWAWEFYNIWSGRIITSALSNLFLRMPIIVFKICNVIIYCIGVMAIFEIIKSIIKIENYIVEDLFLIGLFMLTCIIPSDVINTGMMWVTGAFNYLWPTVFMFVALIPFIKRILNTSYKENKLLFIIYILADLEACFAEQTVLVLLTLATITIIYMIVTKQKITKLLLLHYLIIVVFAIIELLAPGNSVRFTSSTLRRYPSFGMLSLGDKVVQGLILLANQIINNDNKLFVVLTLFIFIKNIKRNNVSKMFKIFSSIPFIYCLIFCIGIKTGIGEKILYNFTYFGMEYIYGIRIYIPILFFAVSMGLISALILFSFDDIKIGILTALIFLGGMASSLTISFSPTVYASGSRVFFLMDTLLVTVIGIFGADICNYIILKSKKIFIKRNSEEKI